MTIAADLWLARPPQAGRRAGGKSPGRKHPAQHGVLASPDFPSRPAALRAARAS